MALPGQNDIQNCCECVDPCKALCMLEHVELNLALGKEITSYSIGEERFQFKKPSLGEVRTLIEIYRKRCNVVHGRPARRRGGGNLRFVERHCRRCGRSSCGC